MEVVKKLVVGLPLKFHEDDSFGYRPSKGLFSLIDEPKRRSKRLTAVRVGAKEETGRTKRGVFSNSAPVPARTEDDNLVHRLFADVKMIATRVK